MPWIHLDDLCRLFSMAIQNKWEGSYNAFAVCSSNLEFSRALASALRRPFFMPNIPEKLLYLFLGERAIMLVGGIKA
jgi:NAD dependent epimerase/dehydratase family enzyme